MAAFYGVLPGVIVIHCYVKRIAARLATVVISNTVHRAAGDGMINMQGIPFINSLRFIKNDLNIHLYDYKRNRWRQSPSGSP